MQEDPAIAFPRATLVRWLVSAVLAGFVLGGGLAYLLVPKGRTPDSRPAEAYIDTRTGQLISAGFRVTNSNGQGPAEQWRLPAGVLLLEVPAMAAGQETRRSTVSHGGRSVAGDSSDRPTRPTIKDRHARPLILPMKTHDRILCFPS